MTLDPTLACPRCAWQLQPAAAPPAAGVQVKGGVGIVTQSSGKDGRRVDDTATSAGCSCPGMAV